ncbi:MAG: 4Fe-4S binding protein [Candidatus Lokiarchaeota archaeon]
MARPLWFVKIIKKAFPGIKTIAKLSRIPFLGKLFELLLFKGDEIIYLPDDKIIQINKEVDKPQDLVVPSEIIKYFINRTEYLWKMDFCICRSSMDCQDYPIDYGCLFLGKGILDINPSLGKKISRNEALDYIQKCSEAGLVHLIGKNRLDKQWLGVHDGDKLLTICNCCPCCCLWRIAPILEKRLGSKVKKVDGVEVHVTEKCIGCGICTDGICFVDAIHLINHQAVITDECRGCGRCVSTCPQKAIEISFQDNDYISKSIERIEKIIDLS